MKSIFDIPGNGLSNVFRLIKPLKIKEELAFYFWFLMVKGPDRGSIPVKNGEIKFR